MDTKLKNILRKAWNAGIKKATGDEGVAYINNEPTFDEWLKREVKNYVDLGGVTNKKKVVKIDDTTAFGCSDKLSHSKHRVFVDGLRYSEALMLKKLIENAMSDS